MKWRIKFERGTLVLEETSGGTNAGQPNYELERRPGFMEVLTWDRRSLCYRAPGYRYRQLILLLQQQGIDFVDECRKYQAINLTLISSFEARDHQNKAISAWIQNELRGCVCLPTGAGKTILAMMTIHHVQRPTLILVPTIDLMLQWEKVLKEFFGIEVGMLGGGEHRPLDLTVATYDSAAIHIEHLGDRFGFLICDECHHLPAPIYQKIAIAAIAPFRLGLSATYERADQKEQLVYELLGSLIFNADIKEMVAKHLAPYDVVTIEVDMSEKERRIYDDARALYINFLRQNQIKMGGPNDWQTFVMLSSRSAQGRQAMRAYQLQKKMAQSSSAKFGQLWKIIQKHHQDRVIIFTDNNELAYQIGRTFLLPVLTHQTKAKERKQFLDAFATGLFRFLVTSKVLNEGVDVPEASVAVIMSGSATVREHVQRLGRILRHKEGKQAVLYELISKNTSEKFVNQKRRQHHAYQGLTPLR